MASELVMRSILRGARSAVEPGRHAP